MYEKNLGPDLLYLYISYPKKKTNSFFFLDLNKTHHLNFKIQTA